MVDNMCGKKGIDSVNNAHEAYQRLNVYHDVAVRHASVLADFRSTLEINVLPGEVCTRWTGYMSLQLVSVQCYVKSNV